MAAEERAFRLEIAGAEGFPESMAFEEERPPADAGGRLRPAAGKLPPERKPAPAEAPAEEAAEALGNAAAEGGLAGPGWRRAAAGPGSRPFAKLLKADGREALKPEELSESLAPAAARPLEGAAPMAAEERAFRLEIAGAEGFSESMAFEEERPPADAGGRQRPAAGKLPPERKPAPAEALAEDLSEAPKPEEPAELPPEALAGPMAPAAPRPRQPEGL